ncbi:DUF6009 family protein [Streptomyces sp. ND04-05B]|uniref:DUF6009 family protein n=1 Tax=Streptomyces sp. ND04-05B TaxID=3028693 RepID=UPI0029AEDEC5|nr:DUF6009 family protein [Streptomyces sp. ND04-05B]MDX3066825.1 DUF6009 family protein [Streptomyces sp. ND04-05B]
MSKDPADIQHEERIVWTEDIDGFDYVRETLTAEASTRARPVPWHGAGRRVGYSTLKRDAPSNDSAGRFTRRIFWVKEHDRSERPDGVYKTATPSEGVDPRTVAPGVWGEVTERAWGGPLPGPSDTPMSATREEAKGRVRQPDQPGPSRSSAASSKEKRTVEQGVTKAFADWLYLHEVSVPETLGAAIGEEFKRWLWANNEELIAAIANAVAQQTTLPEQPPSTKEQ